MGEGQWNGSSVRAGQGIGVVAVVVVALLGAPSMAWADADSLVTLGASTRVAYQTPGVTEASSEDYSFHVGLRLELLYLFGAEIEYTPVPERLADDIYRPSLRLTGHLHLLNLQHFDLYLGVGMASDSFAGVVDPEGEQTLYRMGGGFEIIPGHHWAIGFDGYWNVAGLGHYNTRLGDSLQEGDGVPDPREQLDPGMMEFGVALRY
ncbi:MAG: hypothetical protein AAFS10_18875, partial [Myxococcota bacterium]